MVFQENTDRSVKYFILNEDDGNFLWFSKLTAVAQKDLKKCDFLQGIVSVRIFSARFVGRMSSSLESEVVFFD